MSEGAAVVFGPIVLKYGLLPASEVGAARNCEPRPSDVAEVGWLLGVLEPRENGGAGCNGCGCFGFGSPVFGLLNHILEFTMFVCS